MAMRGVAVLTGAFVFAVAGTVVAQVPMTGDLPDFDTTPPAPPLGATLPLDQCARDASSLAEAKRKGANLIYSAREHKAPREDICQLYKDLAVVEEKLIKLEAACQFPPQTISRMKAQYDHTLTRRGIICGVEGPGQPVGPPRPRLKMS